MAERVRLRPRTLARARHGWSARRRAGRAALGRLGLWRPALGCDRLDRSGPAAYRVLVRRPMPRLLHATTVRVHPVQHRTQLRTVVLVAAPAFQAPPSRPGAAPAAAEPRLTAVTARSAPRLRAPATPQPSKPRPDPVAGTAATTLRSDPPAARVVPPPAAGFVAPPGRVRPRIVVAAPVVPRPDPRRPARPGPTAAPPATAPVPASGAALRPAAAPAPTRLDDLVDQVLRRIERRAIAQRERLGRF